MPSEISQLESRSQGLAWKDGPILLWEATVSVIKASVHYCSKILRSLRTILNLLLPMFYKCNNKAWLMAHLFTTWFTECFEPTIEKNNLVNKIPFKLLILVDNLPGHPRTLMSSTMRLMLLFSCLRAQHPFCSPYIEM
jgi:hypothetical protein